MPKLKQGKIVLYTTDRFGPDNNGVTVRTCSALVISGSPNASLRVFYDGQGGAINANLLVQTSDDDYDPHPPPGGGIGTWRHT